MRHVMKQKMKTLSARDSSWLISSLKCDKSVFHNYTCKCSIQTNIRKAPLFILLYCYSEREQSPYHFPIILLYLSTLLFPFVDQSGSLVSCDSRRPCKCNNLSSEGLMKGSLLMVITHATKAFNQICSFPDNHSQRVAFSISFSRSLAKPWETVLHFDHFERCRFTKRPRDTMITCPSSYIVECTSMNGMFTNLLCVNVRICENHN